MVTHLTLRRIALTLPGVEDASSHGTPGFAVKGKFLAWVRDDDVLVIKIDAMHRDVLMQAEPDTFYITDHYRPVRSNGWTYLLVRLAKAREGDVQELFERAWRHEAPKRLVAAYDATSKS
jgi:hypothetical protein